MDIDATRQVKPGRNVIGVRASTSLDRDAAAEGSLVPLFLYSPKEQNQKTGPSAKKGDFRLQTKMTRIAPPSKLHSWAA